MPLYEEDNLQIKDFVNLVEQMEAIVHEEWKNVKSNPFEMDVEAKGAIQKKLDTTKSAGY